MWKRERGHICKQPFWIHTLFYCLSNWKLITENNFHPFIIWVYVLICPAWHFKVNQHCKIMDLITTEAFFFHKWSSYLPLPTAKRLHIWCFSVIFIHWAPQIPTFSHPIKQPLRHFFICRKLALPHSRRHAAPESRVPFNFHNCLDNFWNYSDWLKGML